MKKQLKGFVSGVLATVLVLGLIGTAVATVGRKTVEVDYNDIKVTMNGSAVNLVDANGAPVEPFAINGTTYLPVRAVSSALGLNVDWNNETKTVILSTEKQMTLNFSFGERTGTYSGSVNTDGIPNGQGVFATKNETGETWTYTGEWENGHFSGAGTTTWDDGQRQTGIYVDDNLSLGIIQYEDGTSFNGAFSDENNAVGVYTDENGDTYEAEMKDGEITYWV